MIGNCNKYDVKNDFLHGELEEEIFVSILSGLSGSDGNEVCRLKKPLYGLKQSLRAWFGRFAKVLIANSYKKKNQRNHALFIKHSILEGSHNINYVCG